MRRCTIRKNHRRPSRIRSGATFKGQRCCVDHVVAVPPQTGALLAAFLPRTTPETTPCAHASSSRPLPWYSASPPAATAARTPPRHRRLLRHRPNPAKRPLEPEPLGRGRQPALHSHRRAPRATLPQPSRHRSRRRVRPPANHQRRRPRNPARRRPVPAVDRSRTPARQDFGTGRGRPSSPMAT